MIRTVRPGLALLVASLAAAACSSADIAAPGPSPVGPLYAVVTTVFSGGFDTSTSYIVPAPSLDAAGELDFQQAIELPGNASAWAGSSPGAAFVSIADSAEIQRLELTAEGRMSLGRKLSFAGLGVGRFYGEAVVPISETKAYLLDNVSYRAVVWNPTTMEIEREFPLPGLEDGALPGFFAEGSGVSVGGRIVAAVYYTDIEQEIVGPRSRLVFIDPATDAIEVLTDERCGGVSYLSLAEGDLYGSSDPWTAGIHRIDPKRAPAPCMLRVKGGERSLDASYRVDLNRLGGGRPTGGLIPGPGRIAFLRVLDETQSPVAADATGVALFGARGWATLRVDLAAPQEATPVAGPLVAGGITFSRVDDAVYANDSAADFSSTTLVRMTEAGPVAGVRVKGVPFSIVRLR